MIYIYRKVRRHLRSWGLQIQRAGDKFGNHPKGTLNLEIQYKNKTYDATYKKINE